MHARLQKIEVNGRQQWHVSRLKQSPLLRLHWLPLFVFEGKVFFFDNLRWGADPINHHNKYPLPHGDASSTATPIELDRNDESPTSSTTKTPTATPTNASASTGKASAITAQKQPQQKQQTPIELDTNDDTQTESSTSSSTKTPTATPTNASASTSKASAITTQKQQKQQQLQHNEDDDNNWPPTQILDRIVDEERRMVITFVNCGYIKFADNWVVHLEKLGITNYALVPLDEKTHSILAGTSYAEHTLPVPPFLVEMGKNQTTSNISSVANGVNMFGSSGFRELTMQRPRILELILRKNYTMFYNDVDTVWVHNAWDYFEKNVMVEKGKNGIGMELSLAYPIDGMEWRYRLCTCLMYMTPTDDNLQMLQAWQSTPIPEGKHDQKAFNSMMRKNEQWHGHVMDRTKFPPGRKQDVDWKTRAPNLQDRHEDILHANFMLFADKQVALESVGAWDPSEQFADIDPKKICSMKSRPL